MKLFDENNLTAIIRESENGLYVASIPEIDGITAEGRTEQEAEENLMEALKVIKLVAKRDAWKKQMGYD